MMFHLCVHLIACYSSHHTCGRGRCSLYTSGGVFLSGVRRGSLPVLLGLIEGVGSRATCLQWVVDRHVACEKNGKEAHNNVVMR